MLLKFYGGQSMNITTDKIVSISEANQNFSKTARLVDKLGEVFIFKNNKPKYRLSVIDDNCADLSSEDDTAEPRVSEKKLAKLLKLVKKYPKTFEELLRISTEK
jgi:antitoxin Phd